MNESTRLSLSSYQVRGFRGYRGFFSCTISYLALHSPIGAILRYTPPVSHELAVTYVPHTRLGYSVETVMSSSRSSKRYLGW